MNLAEIARVLHRVCEKDAVLSGVFIDSRQVQPGSLFIAIRGQRFDGHDYLQEIEQKGALAVIVEHAVEGLTIPQLIVPDTITALATIATFYRHSLTAGVIALTGSNGKTTVKEMIACILPAPSFATHGNLNNHIGAPLSVLALKPHHQFAVFELGANHCGEIAHTVAIVQPHVTLINNIAPAHIAGFESLDGVARAKGEIHQGLLAGGTAVINNDDDYANFWDAILANHKVIRFSVDDDHASVHARDVTFDVNGCARFVLITPAGEALISLKVPGKHNVSNAMAAAATTEALGIDLQTIATGLSNFSGVSGRMTFMEGKNRATIIDDTYNANLRSVLTAIDVLSEREGTRILVLGDMGELGDFGVQHHHEIGEAARHHGIDLVMTCGKLSESTSLAFGVHGKHYDSQSKLTYDLLTHLDAHTTVLVKGSRSAAMEKVVHELVG